jgi:hypothetical protein
VEIVPGHYRPQEDAGLALDVGNHRPGRSGDDGPPGRNRRLSTKYRWDVFYGLINKQPEMTGQFSQT